MVRLVHTRDRPGEFSILVDGESLTTKAKILSLYRLEGELKPSLVEGGACLVTDLDPEAGGFAWEALLHSIYLHTVYSLYPAISSKSPLRGTQAPADLEHTLNTYRNVACVNRVGELATLRDAAAGRPAVLALPGPSLDPQALAAFSGRAVIIAVGRALPALLSAGVVPDILYMQDTSAYAWSYTCEGITDRLPTVAVANPVAPIHAHLDAFAFVYKAWNCYPFETVSYPKIEEVAPSSASGAYSLARFLGCDRILLAGFDCGRQAPPDSALPGVAEMADTDEELKMPRYRVDRAGPFRITPPGGRTLETKCDYVTSVQWMKSRAMRDQLNADVEVFESSATGFARGNSVLRPAEDFRPADESFRPEFPRQANAYDTRGFIGFFRERFEMLGRVLAQGRLPDGPLPAPFNCVLGGLDQLPAPGAALTDEQKASVLERLEQCLAALRD
ncbi:DUF115 domain-containing protein [Desulfovibrio aminophilus]|nr:6-hydroxymethylpterin diphosphokinase MptE-like protein [Desulfovibrio aminophilus]MCM0755224.1 DUF115 domain-containing protein [Desulfovibrio aminophilus]